MRRRVCARRRFERRAGAVRADVRAWARRRLVRRRLPRFAFRWWAASAAPWSLFLLRRRLAIREFRREGERDFRGRLPKTTSAGLLTQERPVSSVSQSGTRLAMSPDRSTQEDGPIREEHGLDARVVFQSAEHQRVPSFFRLGRFFVLAVAEGVDVGDAVIVSEIEDGLDVVRDDDALAARGIPDDHKCRVSSVSRGAGRPWHVMRRQSKAQTRVTLSSQHAPHRSAHTETNRPRLTVTRQISDSHGV